MVFLNPFVKMKGQFLEQTITPSFYSRFNLFFIVPMYVGTMKFKGVNSIQDIGVSVFYTSLHISKPPVQDANLGTNCVKMSEI
jgi:hypothetical protein